MSAVMGIARRLYRPLFRSNVSFLAVIVGGAAVGEIFFDGITESLWAGLNRGKSFAEVAKAQGLDKKKD